jgi:hypothetical protein
MSNTIIDTGNLAEFSDLGPDDEVSNMDATKEATGAPMEFHVQMHGHTFRDMEDLIVNAAAQQLVGRYGGTQAMQKQIEERCIEQIATKADAALAKVTSEIIDQPIAPKYPFMKADEKPMTMREFIGLTGRDYLTAYVDNSGKPTTDRHYGKTRIQHLVETVMQQAFKNEIQKATNAAIAEVNRAIRARHDEFLEAEKARVREALAKVAS